MRLGSGDSINPPSVARQAKRRGCIMASALLALLGASDPGQAFSRTVTFCNRTTEAVELAWGYDATGTAETTSQGWRQIAPCSCRKLFSANVRATEFFFLVLRNGTFDALSGGLGPLCVHPANSFKFINQNQSAASCSRAGGRWLNFAQGNATRTNHTVNFRPSGGPGCNL